LPARVSLGPDEELKHCVDGSRRIPANPVSNCPGHLEAEDLYRFGVEFRESPKLVHYGEPAILAICNAVLIFALEFGSSAH
jgi:hypothetical protein